MPYRVTLLPSSHEFSVAEHESVLDAALRERCSVLPYGCRNGTCGSCMATIQSGELVYPDGRPPGLSEREQAEGKALLLRVAERFGLSARAYHRILRVARTIADLDGSATVRHPHIAEAISYRLSALAKG